MPLPKSVTKIKKDGIEFISNVDRAQYTIQELSRAALKDVAKLLRKRMVQELKQLPGMKRHKRIYNSTQYWVRKKDCDLQIGVKHDAWYGVNQELGTKGMPKKGVIRETTFKHIDDIRKIQGQYLSAIEEENRALGLIDEDEEVGDEILT
jgi:HK97 gp10 family phage protein